MTFSDVLIRFLQTISTIRDTIHNSTAEDMNPAAWCHIPVLCIGCPSSNCPRNDFTECAV